MTYRLELKKFARDSSYNLIRTVLKIILGMAISILLARGLGKEARGIYAMALLLPNMLYTFLRLGIGAATVYYVGRGERELVAMIRGNIALALWISALCMGSGFVVIQFAGDTLFPGVPIELLLVSLLTIPISLQTGYLISVLQGLQDFRSFNIVRMIPQVVLLALIILLVWIVPGGIYGALAANIGSNLAALAVLIFLLWHRVRPQRIFAIWVDWAYTRQMLSYALKAHFSNILAFFNYRADMFLLNIMVGAGSVGAYRVAVSLGERLWMLPTAISVVMLPRIAGWEGQEKKRNQLTPLITRHVFWFVLLVAILIWVLAEWGVVLLYSEEYLDTAVALRFLLPGIVMLSVSKIIAQDIAGRGRPGLNSIQSSIAFVVNVSANLILIPRLGIRGVALSTSISYSLLALMKVIMYIRITQVSWTDLLILKRSDIERLYRLAQGRIHRWLALISGKLNSDSK